MPNVMVALPNTGGTVCSTPQGLDDAHYLMPCSNAAKTWNPLKFAGVLQTTSNVMAALPNTGGALCSTPQFGCAVTLPRRETRWNLLGCPKLTKRSQLLVGRSSPYCKDMWGRYCCLTSFSPIVDTCLIAKIYPDKVVQWCADGDFLHHFCVLYFQQPRAAHFRPAF